MSLLFGVPTSTNQSESISTRLLANWSPIGPICPELPSNISPFISSFEIQGHLSIHQTQRALDLIRTSWGWYLSNPNGTNSTVIEGYLANGSFGYRFDDGYNYDASYTSHSHSWSSGPTYALTAYILGLSVTEPAGGSWRLAPQFGDLTNVEGGFVTSLGKFQAAWSRGANGYNVSFETPKGTKGEAELPCLVGGEMPSVVVDGRAVGKGKARRSRGVVTEPTVAVVEGSLVKMNITGGSHTIIVS
jgi:hypothetical protein